PSVGIPALLGPHAAALGTDDEAAGIGMQRFGDQLFIGVGAVGVGGVEEVGAELERAPEELLCARPVLRRAPDVGAEHAHGAKPEPVDLQRTERDGLHFSFWRNIY